MRQRRRAMRRGFTIRDLAVTVACLAVAATLVLSLTGASRNLSQAQVCANNLRQLYAGMTAYVEQYKVYPPHNPYPQYASSRTINGISTGGWDPNIGFIMTHGLGLVPPETETMGHGTGHFIWYTTAFDDLPDVCKCPAMPPSLLDPANLELPSPPAQRETLLYRYALSYQTSGTMRAATTLVKYPTAGTPGIGGRNPAIPDPTSGASGHQMDNCQYGYPHVWVYQKKLGSDPSDPSDSGSEYNCWIQAVQPAEVQQPSRVYYLADSRDYRPTPPVTGFYPWPPAGTNDGWLSGYANKVFLGTRHFEYANVLYLDGRVSRNNQTHMPQWNMEYDQSGNGQSVHWRTSTFATNIRLTNVYTQVHIMPVLMVRGWESFFETNGLVAK